MTSEELTIQKLHWDNIKKGYPYIEDNNEGYVFGIEFGIGLGDTDQQWFTSEAERDGVVEEMVSIDNYLEIEEILDNYLGSWAYATNDQLIEELSMVYLEGLTGLRHMDYHEIVKEWNEYQVEDEKDYGDRT